MRAQRLDSEKTAPFELGHGDDACLLLHGFTGSPWDVRPLGEALAARGLYVKAIRLPGHGTTPEALLHVGHEDWEEAAEQALGALHNFRQIFVAGLSMGALLGLRLAARFPERVHGLALMAPALRLRGRFARALKRVGRTELLELVRPWVEKTGTDLEDEEALRQAPVLARWPLARLRDVWALQAAAEQAMAQVRCPTLVAVAEQDHVAHPEAGTLLVRGLVAAPLVRFISLKRGFHIIPRDRDGPVLASEVGAFFGRLQR